MDTAYLVVLSGFATTMALIAAIGAQNAFVLRQGIRGEHVLPVVAVCTVSDLLLIVAGIAGVGAVIAAHPDVVTVIKVSGAVFLLGYGLLAARRVVKPGTLTPADAAPARLGAVLATCLAMTFLNPHVYLDTVILIGALANEHQDSRWLFGAGAVSASAVWFAGLGFGAKRLRHLFASATTWRVLDAVIAVTMLGLGISLALS
ncbi:L-lysine exporter family protein LysE/ArgO [Mycolicibacterium iranicum]|uniref:L-lysine exporter family protein LysE/ArgO n=1 Tax=Mycolicibacterium iranicum TaxID=912594 RepID=A0A839PWY4_MYCIR|nr:LysE/ArgO family amino acid transporter [Mycolicibacterium iranicum]MBB2988728.1 L-lysine exporter family protein LysE/ArgO [Mycolicibacterium iranicum]